MSIVLSRPNLLNHPAFRGLKAPNEKYLTPGGYTISAIGQKVALKFDRTWSPPAEWQEDHLEHQELPWAWLHEEVYEWIAIAEALRAARDRFTMIELGAGYGRWLVAAAQLARRLRPELPIKLVGIEAEPTHFGWMREHFIDNGLDPAEHELIEAAVDRNSGTIQLCGSDDPSRDYGQHVYSYGDPDRSRLYAVPAIGINELLTRHAKVDLIDMDIQGRERLIVPAGIDEITKQVCRLYISVHEPAEIAVELKDVLTWNGWKNIHSFPFKTDVETEFGPIHFTDGCQYWLNTRVE